MLGAVPFDKLLQCNYNVNMDVCFEWNKNKSLGNIKKHGVSFDEAKTVFYDEYARIISDPEHSTAEDRFIILGLSLNTKLLVVCHCYKEKDEIIRIISARKATRKESKLYRGHLL